MKVAVRSAEFADVSGMKALIGQHWKVNIDYDKELDNRDAIVLVAESVGSAKEPQRQLLGAALMWVTRWNRTGYLVELAVDKAHKGKGIGSKLMRALARKARKRRLRAIIVETQPDSKSAMDFYLRFGLRMCGYNDRYYTNRPKNSHEIAIFFSLDL